MLLYLYPLYILYLRKRRWQYVSFFVNALFKELVDSPQKRTEKTEEVSMILL